MNVEAVEVTNLLAVPGGAFQSSIQVVADIRVSHVGGSWSKRSFSRVLREFDDAGKSGSGESAEDAAAICVRVLSGLHYLKRWEAMERGVDGFGPRYDAAAWIQYEIRHPRSP